MASPTDPYPDLFEELAERRRRGERVVVATIVALHGSVPRQVGARMLVLADGSIRGTIGGGTREGEVIEAARRLHGKGGSRLLTLDFEGGLKGGRGPMCGGTMEVFMERVDPVRRVLIAGAGHVAYFLHRFLALLEFRTLILDPRSEFASAERFPNAELLIDGFDRGLDDLGLGAHDGIVIVTPEHGHDETVLLHALATEAGYVGMIGSKKKVAAILEHLRAQGIGEGQIGRIHSPIGLAIGAESPAEIALAIAAELVSVSKKAVC